MIGFRLPTHVHLAPGARHRLGGCLASLPAGPVALIVDPGLGATPWPGELEKAIRATGRTVTVLDQVEPNPRTTTVETFAEHLRAEAVAVVVGLGGGSALDAAKAAAMLATNAGRAADFAGRDRFEHAPLPFVALPTTCGTGSEVTWVSVLSDPEARTKISVKGLGMFPTQALVDADLIATLPAPLVAATGADALTHALEATTCTLANPVSDVLAEAAIGMLFRHLPGATRDVAAHHDDRAQVMRASTTAGIAFGNADVASVHCLSEALGGMFDAPHGLTNAILLAPLLRYNRPAVDPRLAALLAVVDPGADSRLTGADDRARADAFFHALERLLHEIGIPPFTSLGIPEDGYAEAAARAEANGSNPSNARPMQAEDYLGLLRSLG